MPTDTEFPKNHRLIGKHKHTDAAGRLHMRIDKILKVTGFENGV